VLISGGTSGIGLGCAKRFVAEGARVWVLGQGAGTLKAALDELKDAIGGSACDVAEEAAVERALIQARDGLGGIDVAFVNVGIDGEGRNVVELSSDHFHRVLEVNILGAFLVARTCARWMLDGGAIVFNASVNALRPEPRFADYNASKAGVVSLAKTMALDLAHRHIAVMAICPGYVPTRMTQKYLDDPGVASELLSDIPAGRFGSPTEVAGLVSFLATKEASYLTGAVIPIDGGRSV
jgi:NAD(P)-dependent dehydrogenase (short-subunit alcohol dehydrogenase family)